MIVCLRICGAGARCFKLFRVLFCLGFQGFISSGVQGFGLQGFGFQGFGFQAFSGTYRLSGFQGLRVPGFQGFMVSFFESVIS